MTISVFMGDDVIQAIIENSRLSHQEAQVYFLKYRQDNTISEIADKLDVEEGTVRKVLDRIKKKKAESVKTVELLEDVN